MSSELSTTLFNGNIPNANDIVVALMGMTGSGKSSLVSLCTNEDVEIGHDLQACTQDVRTYSFHHPKLRSGRVYLVDTPGFDDTNKSDTEVLRTLATWLTATYSNGVKLSGIIYLHRINQPRMQGSAMKNISLFRFLCGDDALKKVILVTTMWDITENDIAESREKQLRDIPKYWGGMIAKGSQVKRHNNTQRSALALFETFMKGDPKIVLNIQSEMVDGNKPLQGTAAANDIKETLAEQSAQLKREIQDFEVEVREALRQRDETLAEVMRELRLERQQDLQQILGSQQRLQVTMQELHESKAVDLMKKAKKEQPFSVLDSPSSDTSTAKRVELSGPSNMPFTEIPPNIHMKTLLDITHYIDVGTYRPFDDWDIHIFPEGSYMGMIFPFDNKGSRGIADFGLLIAEKQ
ncbi:hypothetical protein EKO27_g7037 [Xylaria grammica]|uniref:G domain-containing protein n=1 Tax=Xylaria grammica TaxID=363999 RepID=A0A439D0V1_9PEZI|nr:hypothetical protein EKO27_g7037 [Xylaria grammica]